MMGTHPSKPAPLETDPKKQTDDNVGHFTRDNWQQPS